MASKSRPTQLKRQRERQKAERRTQKAQRREEAKSRRTSVPRGPGDEDPDIAGIVPGPQPPLFDDFEEEEEREEP